MSNEADIIQKRQEVQQEILRIKEHSPTAQILNRLGRPFKRGSVGYWLLNIVLLNIILISPWFVFGILLNEIQAFIHFLIVYLLGFEVAIFGLVFTDVIARYVLDNLSNRIVEKINHLDDLSKLLVWLKKNWSIQSITNAIVPFWVIWVLLSAGGSSLGAHKFVGVSSLLTTVFMGALAGVVFHVSLWINLLILKLKDYQYEINALSPIDSQIIYNISDVFKKCTYMMAIWFAIVTLFITSGLFDESVRILFSFPLMLIIWAMIVTQFSLTGATVRAIVNREKWKTLNKLQAQINEIQATGNLTDKETTEGLWRLMDIHKHVAASKMNVLNWDSLSTLTSQLMLPLLGLLLGNLDKLSQWLP